MQKITPQPTKRQRPSIRHNLHVASLLILIPLLVGAFTLYFIFGQVITANLGNLANKRVLTVGAAQAESTLTATKPTVGPQFSYFQLQPGQNLQWAAGHFSVSLSTLESLNPGTPIGGTTIKVPPVEGPLVPLTQTPVGLQYAVVQDKQGVIIVTNSFFNPEVQVTIPQLMSLLNPEGAIQQIGPKTFRILKPLSIQDNIRVDITSETVTNLQLKSDPNYAIAPLTFKNSKVLLKNVAITSFDTVTGKPDTDYKDGRAFLRALQNARMDMINSQASDLGMDSLQLHNATVPSVANGGIYGVSWRIHAHTYGKEIVTGWVQGSTFERNHIGAYTFGASGMQWIGNLFTRNDIYGLDPHDDSNNATIENNTFSYNGKHGFIVSKRCDYNTIKNNVSIDNKLHGFMLHDSSQFNIIENNISIGNTDNYVVYNSDDNIIQNNRSYNPRGSAVRINGLSSGIYVLNNQFYGGGKGVFIYDNSDNILISGNKFQKVGILLITRSASEVVYSDNVSEKVGYKANRGDRVIFGLNTIDRQLAIDQSPTRVPYQ